MIERAVITGEVMSPSILDQETQIAHPDFHKLIDGLLDSKEELQLTPMQVDLVNYFKVRVPYPVDDDELIQSLWGGKDAVIIDREKSLYKHISRLREKIGRFEDGAMVLYQIYGSKQYLLSPKLEVGKWIVPQDRTEKLQEFKEEVRPLMKYCFQVQVEDSMHLKSRLGPSEHIIAEMLGMEYSEEDTNWVTKKSLVQKVWGDRDGVVIDDDNERLCEDGFWVYICRLRGKIKQFNNGAFDIESDRRGSYRIARAG